MCSPSLLRRKLPRTPADLAGQVFIHHRSSEAWREWLANFGVELGPDLTHGPALNEMSLVIDAAIAGQGIALARSALADRDIADGRLIRPMRQEKPAGFAYWIVCPLASAKRENVVRFETWLLSQAERGADRG